jgi:hypothetical protein
VLINCTCPSSGQICFPEDLRPQLAKRLSFRLTLCESDCRSKVRQDRNTSTATYQYILVYWVQCRISSSTKDSVDTRVPAIGVGGTGAGGNLFILDTSSIGFRRGKRTCATSESSGGVATSTAILALRAAVKSTRATHGLCVPRRRISLRLQRPRHPAQPRV